METAESEENKASKAIYKAVTAKQRHHAVITASRAKQKHTDSRKALKRADKAVAAESVESGKAKAAQAMAVATAEATLTAAKMNTKKAAAQEQAAEKAGAVAQSKAEVIRFNRKRAEKKLAALIASQKLAILNAAEAERCKQSRRVD